MGCDGTSSTAPYPSLSSVVHQPQDASYVTVSLFFINGLVFVLVLLLDFGVFGGYYFFFLPKKPIEQELILAQLGSSIQHEMLTWWLLLMEICGQKWKSCFAFPSLHIYTLLHLPPSRAVLQHICFHLEKGKEMLSQHKYFNSEPSSRSCGARIPSLPCPGTPVLMISPQTTSQYRGISSTENCNILSIQIWKHIKMTVNTSDTAVVMIVTLSCSADFLLQFKRKCCWIVKKTTDRECAEFEAGFADRRRQILSIPLSFRLAEPSPH